MQKHKRFIILSLFLVSFGKIFSAQEKEDVNKLSSLFNLAARATFEDTVAKKALLHSITQAPDLSIAFAPAAKEYLRSKGLYPNRKVGASRSITLPECVMMTSNIVDNRLLLVGVRHAAEPTDRAVRNYRLLDLSAEHIDTEYERNTAWGELQISPIIYTPNPNKSSQIWTTCLGSDFHLEDVCEKKILISMPVGDGFFTAAHMTTDNEFCTAKIVTDEQDSYTSCIQLWNIDRAKPIYKQAINNMEAIRTIEKKPDDATWCVASDDIILRLDPRTPRNVQAFHASTIKNDGQSVVFDESGNYFYTFHGIGGNNWLVKIDMRNSQRMLLPNGCTGRKIMNSDGKRLFVSDSSLGRVYIDTIHVVKTENDVSDTTLGFGDEVRIINAIPYRDCLTCVTNQSGLCLVQTYNADALFDEDIVVRACLD